MIYIVLIIIVLFIILFLINVLFKPKLIQNPEFGPTPNPETGRYGYNYPDYAFENYQSFFCI
nr:unknown [Pieris rapae granulovirus]